jgi:hypothetical protein
MKKKEIINIIAEEISNMFEQSRDSSEIVHNWVSSISMDNNILELCNILAPESMKDSGDRFSIGSQVQNIFETHQQEIIGKLQQLVYDNELEEEPWTKQFKDE